MKGKGKFLKPNPLWPGVHIEDIHQLISILMCSCRRVADIMFVCMWLLKCMLTSWEESQHLCVKALAFGGSKSS